ncbi:hypothetical protein [Cereibacter changlensis]|uniref:hypothetical protein n=1 Tax=Cereibacter changlensis TaxID=402884 RepID=UPI00145CD4F9|nr:hypothetical protein [Cereibacter changlensis]
MRSAYDEVMGNGIKRQHEPPRIVGDLLQSEIAEVRGEPPLMEWMAPAPGIAMCHIGCCQPNP